MQPFQKAWTLLKGTEDWHHNAAHSLNLMLGGYNDGAEGKIGYAMLDDLDNQHFFADDRDNDLWNSVMLPLSMHIDNMYMSMVGDHEKFLPMMQEYDKNAAEHREAQEHFKQFMAGEEEPQPEPNTNYPIEQRLGVDSSGYPLD